MSAAQITVKDRQLSRRQKVGAVFAFLFALATLSALLVLLVLGMDIFIEGAQWLSWDFLVNYPSRFPERAGIRPALVGTIWIMALTALITFPVGVGAAIYLEEFAGKNPVTSIIRVNISNLAGVPSIVYGLLGLAVFVTLAGLGPSVLAGALTLSLLILPIIIIASSEAIRAVPDSIRQGALALGATRLQVVRSHVFPAALPGIMTGTILSLSRAIGEAAPLIVIGAVTFMTFTPDGLGSRFSVLPIQTFEWAARPQQEFHQLAAAAAIVLLVLLLAMNAVAIFVRNHYQKKQNW